MSLPESCAPGTVKPWRLMTTAASRVAPAAPGVAGPEHAQVRCPPGPAWAWMGPRATRRAGGPGAERQERTGNSAVPGRRVSRLDGHRVLRASPFQPTRSRLPRPASVLRDAHHDQRRRALPPPQARTDPRSGRSAPRPERRRRCRERWFRAAPSRGRGRLRGLGRPVGRDDGRELFVDPGFLDRRRSRSSTIWSWVVGPVRAVWVMVVTSSLATRGAPSGVDDLVVFGGVDRDLAGFRFLGDGDLES